MTFALAGLLLTSLEGAADAVRVAHGDGDAGAHDMHHPVVGDDRHDGDHEGGGAAGGGEEAHLCHCTAHLPPLAYGVSYSPSESRYERRSLDPVLRLHLSGPPPLPPPIL